MRSRKKSERSIPKALILGVPEECEVSGLSKTRGTCPMCGKLIESGFAFLNGGALFQVKKGSLAIHPKMEGFLIFGFHGAHGEEPPCPSAEISIADHAPCGQFELYFCTSACLRLFLNRCVDELEERLKARKESLH